MKNYSDFGRKLAAPSGISLLMDGIGAVLCGGRELIMMGGGNPALIPAVGAVWRRRFEEILHHSGALEQMLGLYDSQRGLPSFRETLAAFFKRVNGWSIDADNIAITLGSQSAYFLLFHLLAGPGGGVSRRILFPMVPEYIGYADQGVAPGMFTARKPRIEQLGPHRFKYRIDFEALNITPDIAALCVSRPTNPTANVLTDDELRALAGLAQRHGCHLMVDNAYGAPFPQILFRETAPVWGEHIINTYSLSKLGLPGTRTGIVVASKEIVRRLSAMNAAVILATSPVGQTITEPLFASGEILRLCREVIRPYYTERRDFILERIAESFPPGLDYQVHVCEGAFFVWVWLRGLPLHVEQLYERLKQRNVLVLPGHYFFPGFDEPWQHKQECLRLSYVQPPDVVRRGVQILAEEIERAYTGRS